MAAVSTVSRDGNSILVAVVDLATATMVTEQPTRGWVTPIWSANSSDLFFDDPDQHHIDVWQVAGHRLAQVPAPVPGAVALALLQD